MAMSRTYPKRGPSDIVDPTPTTQSTSQAQQGQPSSADPEAEDENESSSEEEEEEEDDEEREKRLEKLKVQLAVARAHKRALADAKRAFEQELLPFTLADVRSCCLQILDGVDRCDIPEYIMRGYTPLHEKDLDQAMTFRATSALWNLGIARMTYSWQNLEIKGKGICEVPLFIFWSRAGEPAPEIPEELQDLPWFRYEGAATDDELDEIHCSCCG